jgi:hypothetical protein
MRLTTTIFAVGCVASPLVASTSTVPDSIEESSGSVALSWRGELRGTQPSALCTSTDKQVWVGVQRFTNDYQKICNVSWGNSNTITDYLHARYSQANKPCLRCFGDAAECGRSNCTPQCMWDQSSVGCTTCFRNKCKQELINCVGARSEHELPPPPNAPVVTTTTVPPPRPQRPTPRSNSSSTPTGVLNQTTVTVPLTMASEASPESELLDDTLE